MSLPRCERVLGKGANGIAYLADTQEVVKVGTPGTLNENEDAFYEFAKSAHPLASHFVKRHVVATVPRQDIKCEDGSNVALQKDSKKMYMEVLDDAGERVTLGHLNRKVWRDMIGQLLPALAAAQNFGVYHMDVHLNGNVTRKNGKYMIIDYELARRDRNAFDMMVLLSHGALGLWEWIHKNEQKLKTRKDRGPIVSTHLLDDCMKHAQTIGYCGQCPEAAVVLMAHKDPSTLKRILCKEDCEDIPQKWLAEPIAIVDGLDQLQWAWHNEVDWEPVVQDILKYV